MPYPVSLNKPVDGQDRKTLIKVRGEYKAYEELALSQGNSNITNCHGGYRYRFGTDARAEFSCPGTDADGLNNRRERYPRCLKEVIRFC